MANDYYHGNSYGSQHTPSEADLERKAQSEFQQQQKALLSSFNVKEKDGKASLFGFDIPVEIAPAINFALGTLMIPISKGASEFVYTQTKAITESDLIAKNFATAHKNAPKIALYAELATMWGLFSARPIMEFVAANKRYASERWKLGTEIKSIGEATGADCRHNEVVKSAYHHLHENYMTDIQHVIPSILSVVPHAMFGLKMHGETIAKRQKAIELNEMTARIAKTSPNLTPEQHAQQALIEKQNAIQKLKIEERQKFEAQYRGQIEPRDMNEAFKEHWSHIAAGLNPKDPTLHTKGSGFFGENSQDMFNFGTLAGAAQLGGEGWSAMMRKAEAERKKHHTSYELILQLKEQMSARQGSHAVAKAVEDIFQQLEVDMGRTKFAGGLLEKLQEATKPIADAIAEGKLDALALVKLAGENMVVMHTAGGKRSFHREAEIAKTIADMQSSQVNKDNEMSAEQFLATFANPLLAKETIKKALGEFKGEERNFFVSIMPTEILEQAGMKIKDIREARKASHEYLYEQVGASILHIAAQETDMLRNYGVSTKAIEEIRRLSEHILSGDMEAVKMTIDTHSELIATVASVQMNEQLAGKPSVWVERVTEAKKLEDIIAKTKQEKEEKAEGEERKPLAAKHRRHDSHADRASSHTPDPTLGL